MVQKHIQNSMQGMCNILLLGDTKVGKSAIMRRLMDDQFDEEYTPTIMTNLRDKIFKLDQQHVHVQVVDTIGLKAERDLPIISKTIEAADAVFVLFDLTAARTQEIARFWFNQVRKQRRSKEWMIVVGMGTKCEGEMEIDQDGIQSFSRECSAEMVITSAKSGFNVRESFEMMVRKVMSVQRTQWLSRTGSKSVRRQGSKVGKGSKSQCSIY